MKILVLGGTGAMGAELVKILTKLRMQVDVSTRKEPIEKISGVHYLIGNALDIIFLKRIIRSNYNVIVDFMSYNTEEFRMRKNLFLEATEQYIFMSSARVYAESDVPITENTPRLLDVCEDEAYLVTDEYALTKARQENLLENSERKNWTIIRPYITYNNERLQLGVFEKEYWLYRALQGKTIVFTKDIGKRITTLTYGGDVARVLAEIVGKSEMLGQKLQIVGSDSMKWSDVLDIYLDTIEKVIGKRPSVLIEENFIQGVTIMENQYQVYYDRLFKRRFDSSKVNGLCPNSITYISMKEGLEKCLTDFIINRHSFREINWRWEAYADKIAGEYTQLDRIPGASSKVKYLVWRYAPKIASAIKKYGK